MMTVDRIILALDIGSSSVRCTAYRMVEQEQQHHHPSAAASENKDENEATLLKTTIITVEAIPGCSSSSRIMQSVQPNSGYINLLPGKQPNYNDIHSNDYEADASTSLLDEIDSCMDDQLKRLEQVMASSPTNITTTTTSEEEQAELSTDLPPQPPPPPSSYQIVGIGISTFVMNLVGVDREGNLVGPTASCSYACNAPAVASECRSLRQTLGVAHLQRLHQQTGAPLHSAFALPQLRVLYNHHHHTNNQSQKETTIDQVHQWQTIASLCLARWTGKLQAAATSATTTTAPSSSSSPSSTCPSFGPISYSEASWTGLLNIQTCTWDEDALALLPVECQRALPPLADCTDAMVHPGGIPEYIPSSSRENDKDEASTRSTARTKNPYWDRWPALRGAKQNQGDEEDDNKDQSENYCRLFLGLGDGACANIGSLCCTPNRIAVTIGTSAAARVIFPLARQPPSRANKEAVQDNMEADTAATPPPPPQQKFLESPLSSPSLQMLPPGLFCYRIDQSHVLLGGALTDGGSMVEWCRSLLNLSTPESFSECITTVETLLESDYALSAVAAATNCGSNSINNNNSLTMVPFLSGERATGWRDGATGALVGITRETTPAHVLKASMEAVVLRLQAVLQRIQEGMTQMTEMTTTSMATTSASNNTSRPLPPLRIVASGTALERNKLWRQMLADCSGLQVCHLTEIEEATSRGAAHVVANALAIDKDRRQQAPQDTSDDDAVATMDALRPLLQEETLSSTMTVSEPRAFTQPYWKSATGAQETLITTISPLWQ